MQAVAEINLLTGPVLVTIIYFLMWYYLLFKIQVGTKFRLIKEYQNEGKVFDRYFSRDKQMLTADRVVINTLEQMVPFIAALWLHAIFVSPIGASWCGGVYIALRLLYPKLLADKIINAQSNKIKFVTLPCYLIIFYLLGSTAWSVL